MRMPLFLRAQSVRPLLVLSLLFGFAPNLSAAGNEAGSATPPQQVRPTTIRWATEQNDAINGMQKLAAEARFRLPAQRFEQEVLRTDPTLKRAQALLQNPAGDRSVYDDVIRQLQQQRAKLLQLRNEMTTINGQIRPSRGKRQLTSSQFENANQKSTQYINMLSSVLKTMHETRMGVIRNLR